MVLSERNETKALIESLRDELKAMNTSFKKLEFDISIVKRVNNQLMKKCWENAQYSSRECLEIAGIPKSTPQQKFEEKEW